MKGIMLVNSSATYYFEEAPILRAIFHFSLPMILGMSVNVVYSVANAYFLGLLHHASMLSAVTYSLPVLTLLMAIGNFFGTGSSTYIARLLGEGNTKRARATSAYAFYGSILTGVLVSILSLLFIHPLIQLLGTDPHAFAATKSYVTVLMFGSPLIMTNFTLEQLVRAKGSARISMTGMMLNVITNLVLDPLLILGFKEQVFGAALSMVIANGISLLYYLYDLRQKNSVLSVSLCDFTHPWDLFLSTFAIGFSELLLSGFLIISTILFNQEASLEQTNVVASFGISLRLVQIPEWIGMGIAMGMTPLFGYVYGKSNFLRLHQAIRGAVVVLGTCLLTVAIPLFLFRFEVIQLFSQNVDVITVGTRILTAMLMGSLFAGYTALFTAIFQALGKNAQSLTMSITHGILFIPILVVLHHAWGLNGLIAALPVTEVLTFLIGLIQLVRLPFLRFSS
jgi:putative MATE family efflux protein